MLSRIERRPEMPLLIAALLTIPAIEQSSVAEPWGDTVALVLNWTIWLAFVDDV